ncbi:4-hydroxy-tetrahydrodipicolinate reductase [Empedobacter stercoris]|uniref:4-hydroxy-tetrahydrodipicolinate reductase n=1 Tax=Empedobacter TaxID=59734 RepID=UPI0021AE9C8F|nr:MULTISPECIES: 4-hydroxy-tetrahydrodipicolinate reductase [Empedobacter]MDM1524211.1 4-hydroxy-tetrahydrodipicolinate reductase [Empedobacter sp. 225-1]MDM1544131.1 4-hydroxy-tetrahydrodipicolinate reductase [Empedobacter sp. 189-2]UWX67287.1 4-hydroxy-tetrahydrodipicolinate reductase [Empedobacter stercoris]
MKIALIGYGKMGKAIEEILVQRGHDVVLKISRTPLPEELKDVEVAIEFSRPEFAFDNLKVLLENNVATICGTTGWLEKQGEINQLAIANHTAFLYASNFSLGVNLFFELNSILARMMNKYRNEYQINLEEIHHTQKLDAPSGTAITIAEGIIDHSSYTSWSMDEKAKDIIPVEAKRIEDVPGTHIVQYNSEVDTIEISHTAHSRKGFALGAVIAAEWIWNKQGVFTMKDVLELN